MLESGDRVKSLTAKYEAAIGPPTSSLVTSDGNGHARVGNAPRRSLTGTKEDRISEKPAAFRGRHSDSPNMGFKSTSRSASIISPITTSYPSPVPQLAGLGVSQLPSPFNETSSQKSDPASTDVIESPSSVQSPALGLSSDSQEEGPIEGEAVMTPGLGVPGGKKHLKEQRDASGGSSNSGGGQVKTVAFAPSPKKHSQNASGNRAPSPSPPVPNPSRNAPASSSSSANGGQEEVSNFARPTVASTARARSQQQKAGSMSDSLGSPPTTYSHLQGGSDRIPSGASSNSAGRSNSISAAGGQLTQSRLSRNASLGAASRRGSSGVSDAIFPTISHPISISSAPPQSNAGASSLSLSHGAGDTYTHLPNSIPFASSHLTAAPHLRSASPMSFATGSSFATPASRRNSNALSRDPAGSSAGWASAGARSVGGPSWTEMTEEDLVMHLGPRERTRQEVLWEIVASEER